MNNPAHLAAQEALELLREQVRAALREEFTDWNVDPDAVYFTAVDNLENRMVLDSATLTALTVQLILDKGNATFPDWGGSGFFSVAYSFADEHRISNPPPHAKLAEVVNALVGQLG